tara:strand:+ start:207 stop:641 length:435 start_codon:yes stop_codon:yes gene_type:complete
MYSFLIFSTLFSLVNSFKTGHEYFVDLKINYFNNSNCSTEVLKENIITNVCYKNNLDSCCEDIVKNLFFEDNIDFDKCYTTSFDNQTHYSSYQCEKGDFNDLTIIQVMALIGVILIVLIGLCLIVGILRCVYRICCITSPYQKY